jgi:hypothetical protein
MTVEQLSSCLSSEELSEWIAYNSIEPFSVAERIELMLASLMSLTANVNRRKGKKAFRPKDFMPRYDKAFKKQSPETIKEIMMALVNETKEE